MVFFYCITYTDALLWFVANLLPTNFPKPVFPGMGLIIITIILILIGAVTENFILRKAIQLFNFGMSKVPFVKNIYSTALKIVQNFLGSSNTFSKVVLIEYPQKGSYTLAFKTNDAPEYINKLLGEKMISVFLPTTPIPTNGLYLIVPKSCAIETDFKTEEAFRLIVSAGIVSDK